MSAFVFPGAGQLLQRRWAAAALFGVGFIVAFVAFSVYMVRIMFAYYSLAFSEARGGPPDVPLAQALLMFLLAILIYGAGVLDAHRAYLSSGRLWAKRHLDKPGTGDTAS
jgi:hypothetical protein